MAWAVGDGRQRNFRSWSVSAGREVFVLALPLSARMGAGRGVMPCRVQPPSLYFSCCLPHSIHPLLSAWCNLCLLRWELETLAAAGWEGAQGWSRSRNRSRAGQGSGEGRILQHATFQPQPASSRPRCTSPARPAGETTSKSGSRQQHQQPQSSGIFRSRPISRLFFFFFF